MDPLAESTTAAIELHRGTYTLIEDEDLLSPAALAAMQRIADPMGILLVALFFFGALSARADGQLRRRMADWTVGLLPGGAVWRRLLRLEHPLTAVQMNVVANRGIRAGLRADRWRDQAGES
jgi:hypothetical protein